MLEIDQDFISYIIRNGCFTDVVKAGVKLSDFLDQGKVYFRKIKEHYEKYGQCPDRLTFKTIAGISVAKLGKGEQPFSFYIDKIVERRCQQLVISHNERLASAVREGDWKGAVDVIHKSSVEITSSPTEDKDPEVVSLRSLGREMRNQYRKASKAEDGITGYRFPWPSLNEISGGFQKEDYVLFAGDTGAGKSWLLCAIVDCLQTQKAKVLIVPKEMSRVEFAVRLVCTMGKFDHSKVIKGRLEPKEQTRFLSYTKKLEASTRVLFSNSRKINNVRDLQRLVRKESPDVVLVDGTYLFAENTRAPLHERVAESSTALRAIALNEKVLIIGSTQLIIEDRSAKTGLSLADLAYAKSMARDATHLFFLDRDTKMELTNRARILNFKQRKGKRTHVEVNWDIDAADYSEIKQIQLNYGTRTKKKDLNYDDDGRVEF